ncbi:glycoside hydrolase family 15 protein [Mycolicibacterium gadium]|uniref:glycoside hydrolase family 15 protein n=1 Tax=Mycolicibacterium gadium TaxID=1794 RepID=UPI002FDED8C0
MEASRTTNLAFEATPAAERPTTDDRARTLVTPPGPIENYALLADLRTAALVGLDGSIDWLCLPRFDSSCCFARILGDDSSGHWRIGPSGAVSEIRRRYRGDSLVLETEFDTPEGTVRLIDTMTPEAADTDDAPEVLRIVEGVRGTVEVEHSWVVRFAYGHAVPWVRRAGGGILAVAGPEAVLLRGDVLPERVPGERAHRGRVIVRAGERYTWTMQWVASPDRLPPPLSPVDAVAATERFWTQWSSQIRYDGPHAETVRRSLLTLKALTYAPSGGIVAAPTTSLPETPGGERNWDYRFCWLRDATYTLIALDAFGLSAEAAAWRNWLLYAVAGDAADTQIMYGIGGERHLVEWEADWLPGYHGAQPVRIGNGAYRQLQLDVYGEVMDALHVARQRGLEPDANAWALQRGLMAHLTRIWQQPDKGLWEIRGPERYFTHSRVMVWVAFDRAVRAVTDFGLDGPVEQWAALRDAVHAEVLEQGWNDTVGAFTQSYGGTELDAATLLLPAVGFLPGDDPRVLSTLDAVARELKHGDLVERYRTGAERGNDGLKGQEGAFIICSFWFVNALALAGRRAEAEAMFGRLVARTNDVGLLAEEVQTGTGAFLGNFPQAFSHLGLAGSAALLYGASR